MNKLFTLLSLSTFSLVSYGQSNIANGATCPDFTQTDVSGVSQNLYSYCDAGKYVMIDFFAYWCGPCMQTAPVIHNFYTKYGCNAGDVVVIGVESDANSTLADLAGFKQQAGLPSSSFPNILGSAGGSTVRNQYGISAFPTIVLIGPDKKMINNDIWPISGVGTLEAAFPSTANITEMACSTASLDQVELAARLNLFPNPATTLLNIALEGIQNVSIVDAAGKSVFNSTYANSDQIEISVADFQTGMYIVTITSIEGVVTSRFTKQ